MGGTIAQWFGRSFQRLARAGRPCSLNLVSFVSFVFCLNIFYEIFAIALAYKVATLAFDSTAPWNDFLKYLFLEKKKNVNQTALGGVGGWVGGLLEALGEQNTRLTI